MCVVCLAIVSRFLSKLEEMYGEKAFVAEEIGMEENGWSIDESFIAGEGFNVVVVTILLLVWVLARGGSNVVWFGQHISWEKDCCKGWKVFQVWDFERGVVGLWIHSSMLGYLKSSIELSNIKLICLETKGSKSSSNTTHLDIHSYFKLNQDTFGPCEMNYIQ